MGVRFLEGRNFYRFTPIRAGRRLLPFYAFFRVATFTAISLLPPKFARALRARTLCVQCYIPSLDSTCTCRDDHDTRRMRMRALATIARPARLDRGHRQAGGYRIHLDDGRVCAGRVAHERRVGRG